MNKNLQVYKVIALCAVGLYLYKVAKANGGSLANNPMGVKINDDKVVGLAAQFIPKQFRTPETYQLGKAVWDRIANA